MVSVRDLRASDAAACAAIVAGLPYHFGNEEGRRLCDEAVRSQSGIVAVEGDDVVGFLTYVPRFDDALEVTWMAVDARRRRSGVGRAMIERLVAQARAASRTLLLVLTVSPNGDEDGPEDGYPATRAFYRAMGFALARDLPREWPGDVAVLMVRTL